MVALIAWPDPTIVLTAVQVVTTVLYTVLTALIWYAAKQNTQATRDILEAAYRPYVDITRVRLERADTLSSGKNLAIIAKNVGSVPARSVQIDFEVHITGRPPIRESNAETGYVALFPNRIFRSRTMLPPQESLSRAEVIVTAHYQGVTSKKYRTTTTYTKDEGDLNIFVLTAAYFD